MMTAQSMADFIKAEIAKISFSQTSSAGDAGSYSDKMILAFCQGIINEIQTNAKAKGVTPGGANVPIE